jgi:peroxiredoxin (alkyl hydroperoxide reductase subunit C)
MVSVGSKIPDAQLDAFQGRTIKKVGLSDYRGKWMVMLFYPADFTFVCPTELEEAADHYAEFQKEGAEVLSLSTDTAFTHKAWHDHSPAIKKVAYPMLADPGGKVCRQFGTYIEGDGLSLRATFIVDPEGVVQSIEMHSNDIGRNIKETLRKLRAAKFVREHRGMVCPASWDVGKETLTPGVDLIGKI